MNDPKNLLIFFFFSSLGEEKKIHSFHSDYLERLRVLLAHAGICALKLWKERKIN